MDIKLLAAPVILPPESGATADSTSLVLARGLQSANRIIPRSAAAYPHDSYVWSVLAGDNGSFHFYAVPLKNYLGNSKSSGRDDSFPAYALNSGWNTVNASNAAAQYRLQASVPAPMCGQMLNVYA